ncbi:unnamed protein product [Spirodela intermedia]|uniref:Uncharacterized protein n=1 Tax=Spirodela intermedia TaxID=51605 RepID=A0A7I8IME8_SPIIN|nr:unnamed protein product [Spirodela intermedia]CAA6658141.1 unnamed protein product [Spirodela intermedia]
MGAVGSEEVVTERGLILVERKTPAPVVLAGGSSSSGGGSPPPLPLPASTARGSRPPQALVERLKDYGQEDAFAYWDELSLEERDLLIKDIQGLDLPRVDRIVRCSLKSHGCSAQKRSDYCFRSCLYSLTFYLFSNICRAPLPTVEPVPEASVSTLEERTLEERERWWKAGLKAISEGKLAVLLLAGGQGTRLGSSDPKGCFNIGLPSGKSLFQLQAERILCVQRLASQSVEGAAGFVPIHWYIMTSPFTDDATRKVFESHKYFGMETDQVTFFQQGTLPCVSKDGRFIMEAPYKVAKAPDGNGGVYSALKSVKLLEDMAARGVKYVDCYGVDNALVRVADPTFLGYFVEKGVPAAAKVVRKGYPQEKVGVFVRRGRGGPLSVLEYSEMDSSMACEINQTTGRLRYCWSNVCLHMFTLDFLNQVANGLEKDSIYHLAEKKIHSVLGFTTGFKLEQFVFDAFTYAPSTALFELRYPDSARLLLLRLHTRWVVAAGGFLTHSVPLYATGVEISPLCSYTGENLEAVCRGRTFHAPCEISF